MNVLTAQLLDTKVIYRRYASLFFVCGIGSGDNELVTLEIIHRYVEVLDRYFGNVRLCSHPVPAPSDSIRSGVRTGSVSLTWNAAVCVSYILRIFNFQKAYAVSRASSQGACLPDVLYLQILDELIIAGELQESSKKSVLRVVSANSLPFLKS